MDSSQQPAPDQPDGGYGTEHRRDSWWHDWRLKAAIQTVLSAVPAGARLNFLLQRHVTKTLPISDIELDAQVKKAQRNLHAFARFQPEPLPQHVFEFGVGWDLLMPLVHYSMGVERQTAIDLRPLARVDLVMNVARRLAQSADRLGLKRAPVVPDRQDSVAAIANSWGIDYRAPADARNTGLPDGAFDLVTSTDVLEHVPVADISAILKESRRILRDDGLMRIRIDYQDHYWYFDANVSPYGFLRFGPRAWRRYNPPLHYQNRLRHGELIELLLEGGFTALDDDHPAPTSEDLAQLDAAHLDARFRAMPPKDVAVRFANLSLRKRGADDPLQP